MKTVIIKIEMVVEDHVENKELLNVVKRQIGIVEGKDLIAPSRMFATQAECYDKEKK